MLKKICDFLLEHGAVIVTAYKG